jgi:hypothetical protein
MTEALAREFSHHLIHKLGELILIVNHRNKTNPDAVVGHICHSHDFCDANQIMLDACESLGLRHLCDWSEAETDEEAEIRTGTWNKAWDMAKTNDFYVVEFLTGEK